LERRGKSKDEKSYEELMAYSNNISPWIAHREKMDVS
jgi:hypothetical protein